MPVGDIAGEALGAVARFLGWIFLELIFEIVICGTGHMVLKAVRLNKEPGETAEAVGGFLIIIPLVALGTWFVLSMRAGASAPTQNSQGHMRPIAYEETCANPPAPASYPPVEPLLQILQPLKEVPTEPDSCQSVTGAQYRSHAVVRLQVGRDGLVQDALIEKSSGNRTVDRAVWQWARAVTFPPGGCDGKDRYQMVLPVDLNGRTAP